MGTYVRQVTFRDSSGDIAVWQAICADCDWEDDPTPSLRVARRYARTHECRGGECPSCFGDGCRHCDTIAAELAEQHNQQQWHGGRCADSQGGDCPI